MSTSKRLTEVFESAEEIEFDDNSKFIFFSDVHRGDNSWADDFAHNQNLFFYALQYYLDEGFTYIEIGDGDELWENTDFKNIRRAHSHVFWLMRKFYRDNRLYLIWGNHDMERKDPKKVEETLYEYYDERLERMEPLFKGIKLHEGLILRHSGTDDKIFLVHGHQVDPINDRWWKFSRFFVRHFWRHMQIVGVNDPTSPAERYEKRIEVEKRLIEWVEANNQMLIAGHTHRSRFAEEGAPPYFNDGCCVHPRCVTGIEINNGVIVLIKWWIRPNDKGMLYVAREELLKPKELKTFFKRS